MNNQHSIAIIGAGPAGLHCAAALQARGFSVRQISLYEKSRGIGGRLACRRRPGFEWYHGAPIAHLEPGKSRGTKAYREGLKLASSHFSITFGAELQRIEPDPLGEATWSLCFTDGRSRPCDTLLFCLPAPQIKRVMERSRIPPLSKIDDAVYETRFSLLLGLKRPLAEDPELKQPFIDQSIGADRRSVVLHANGHWSNAHLELQPAAAALRLLARVPTTLKQQRLLRVMAHRWRFALVAEPAGTPCIWDEQRRIGAAGDWCLGRNVGAAINSGVALAQRL